SIVPIALQSRMFCKQTLLDSVTFFVPPCLRGEIWRNLSASIAHATFAIQSRKLARIGCQRDQREVIAIQVIRQVKHPWEPCTRALIFIPAAVRLLCFQQIKDAALHALTTGITRSQQAHDGPRGLRRRARTDAAGGRLVIRSASLAPAAVGILDHPQPLRALL